MSSHCADNLVLIGFMGAGKSTVGRILARETGRYFLDADALIETAQGRAVATIFDKEGEAYFRELEKESARWLAECVRGCVLSTGGGMPTVVKRLREIGTVVYLRLSFDTILARLTPEERARRPLFHDETQARRLYDARARIYEAQADLIVDADRPADQIATEILRRLQDA
jgi:shikimate kinase